MLEKKIAYLIALGNCHVVTVGIFKNRTFRVVGCHLKKKFVWADFRGSATSIFSYLRNL